MADKRKPGWWVVYDPKEGGQVGRCQRCGKALNLEMPMNLKAFVMYLQAFVQEHSHCQEPPA